MKKQISYLGRGQRADIGDTTIYRILPNRYTDAVGPFVFLDHIAPAVHHAPINGSTGPHPHRGIATLSYILHGQVEHFDSIGNRARVSSGGVQWMKAGSGIVHDEFLTLDTGSNLTHGFQFWISLPAVNKAEKPEYMAIQASEVPMLMLEDGKGWMKIIVGEYEILQSVIPCYSRQFLYHVHLEAGKHFRMAAEAGLEYAAFVALGLAQVNERELVSGEFIEFDRKKGTIEILNVSALTVDVLLFGGENYAESIVAEGPFVMNSRAEIAMAYQDYYAGKYGEITKMD